MARIRAKHVWRDTDRGWKRLIDSVKKADGGAHARVGLLGDVLARGPGDEIGVVELGTIHEYGAPKAGIPERSFLRRTFDAKRGEWMDLCHKLAKKIFAMEMSTQQALGILGAKASADVKATITQGPEIPPPASPYTLAKKIGKTQETAASAAKAAEGRHDARIRQKAGPQTRDQHFASEQRKFAAAGKAAARATEKRGPPRNLVDSGRLVGSITWKVHMGDDDGDD